METYKELTANISTKSLQPLVYAIILNYNNLNDTIETIKSVRETDYSNLKLLLVENSDDRIVIDTIIAAFPDIEILETGNNKGYAGGNNQGIWYAMKYSPDYIFILNNDVSIDPSATGILVHEMEADLRCAASQPLVLYYDAPEKIWSAGTEWFFGYPRLYKKNSFVFPSHTKRSPFGLVGSSILFRASALREIGLFDESLFFMHEETEWCIRAKKAGFSLLAVPDARVWHKVSATIGSLSEAYLYYVSRNWILVSKKHYRGLRYFYILLTEFLIRFPYYCLLLLKAGELPKIRYYFRGIKDGIKGVCGEYIQK